jgi:hypothetical protein
MWAGLWPRPLFKGKQLIKEQLRKLEQSPNKARIWATLSTIICVPFGLVGYFLANATFFEGYPYAIGIFTAYVAYSYFYYWLPFRLRKWIKD